MDEECIRLTSYSCQRQRTDRRPAAGALTELYARREVTASIVLRGIGGSVTVAAVGARPGMEALLGQAAELTGQGLLTIGQARLLTGDIDPVWLGEEPGEATMLTVFLRRADHVYQVPAFEAVCELLYRRGVAAATVLPGIDGTISGRRTRPQSLRHGPDAPLAVIAVGSGNEIAMVLPELGMLFRHPVMTVEKVRLSQRDGQAASLLVPPAGVLPGTAALLRLTAYTREAARHDGQPVHRAITRQLGQAGVTGVTTVAGIWGFHGDHAPHGDQFPRLGRHAPVVITVTGTPERIGAAFGGIATLTTGCGLVTAETVLAMRSLPSRVPDLSSRCMRRRGSPLTAVTANGPCPMTTGDPVARTSR